MTHKLIICNSDYDHDQYARIEFQENLDFEIIYEFNNIYDLMDVLLNQLDSEEREIVLGHIKWSEVLAELD